MGFVRIPVLSLIRWLEILVDLCSKLVCVSLETSYNEAIGRTAMRFTLTQLAH